MYDFSDNYDSSFGVSHMEFYKRKTIAKKLLRMKTLNTGIVEVYLGKLMIHNFYTTLL